MKVLVRATNWLGDAVISIPALREIRRAHPGAEIVILARQWVADLYAREDFCDRILVYENKGLHAGVLGRLRLAQTLRREQFDKAILLPNAFDAAMDSIAGPDAKSSSKAVRTSSRGRGADCSGTRTRRGTSKDASG